MSSDLMRLAGINSGYDTEAMIEKMMSSYQTKIDNQNKKLQKLTWQQDAYRDITSKLSAFKNKYFDIVKRDTYLMSPTVFNKFKTTLTSKTDPTKEVKGINVTTSSSSIEGTHTLKVNQVATATKLTGKEIIPANFKLDVDKAANMNMYELEDGERTYSYSMDVKVGGVSRTVDFEVKIAEDADGKIDMDEFTQSLQDSLNAKLEDVFGVTGKTTDIKGGLNANGEEMFLKAEKDDDGNLKLLVGGNADVTITEKEGNFGLATPVEKLYLSMNQAVTGLNTAYVEVDGVGKTISFVGYSDAYYDARNDAGNEALLNEYNYLKQQAFARTYPNQAMTEEALENFTYTSSQAAADKNSMALADELFYQFGQSGVDFGINLKTGELSATKDGKTLEFSITSISGGTLGITKASASNKYSTNTTLKNMGLASKNDEELSLTINGKEIKVTGGTTIDGLMKAVNSSGAGVTMTYHKLENRFTITANDLGNGGDVEVEANELTAALGLSVDKDTALAAEIGKNAIIELDGVEIYHNSNSYGIDGTTIDFTNAQIGEEVEFGLEKNYDDIKQVIRDFVDDYNKLIDDVYAYIGTSPKRDSDNNLYEPLTEAEKEEMSEKEIEKWEEAAKQGILYNDSTVSSIMTGLRSVLYTSITLDDGTKFNLYSMGIKTMSFLDSGDVEGAQRGKLTIDEDRLDKAFREMPDAVEKLFTDSENGVMSKINQKLDNAVRSSATKPGTLVRRAGLSTGTSAKDNYIYKQMEQINKRIETLKKRYEQKEDYWWSVFTNLEKMMSSMNSQMSYMSSYLGSNTTSTQ